MSHKLNNKLNQTNLYYNYSQMSSNEIITYLKSLSLDQMEIVREYTNKYYDQRYRERHLKSTKLSNSVDRS